MRSFSPFRLGLATIGLVACWGSLAAAPVDVADPPPQVVSVRLAMPIHPIAADHLERSLAHAAAIDAAAVVVELDTPGGSLPATRRMVQAILGSAVPVVVWVGPGGAQAASAGFFLLLAADAAVMAPGTNTGAAHPVAGSGQDLDGELARKVEEDTLALARSLAEQRGRDLELAQAAVRDSRSFTADEALAAGLIDQIAADVPTALDALHGQVIASADGSATETWQTAAAVIETRRLSAGKRLLAALAHPQIAGLLMALGMLGLYVEISNPGLILPGTFGAIALVLGAFALSVLPINTAGLALLALALVFFVAETQVPTFGVLTAGGAVALMLGLSMLFEDLGPGTTLDPWFVVVVGVLAAVFAGFTSWQTLHARRRPPSTGREGLIGEEGSVRGDFAASDDTGCFRGKVFVHGELWSAEARTALTRGDTVEVESLDGLLLRVRPASGPPTSGSLA